MLAGRERVCQVLSMLRQIQTHIVKRVPWNLCWVTAGVSSRSKVAQSARPLTTEIYASMFQQFFTLKSVMYTSFNNNNDNCQHRNYRILYKFICIIFDIFRLYNPAACTPLWSNKHKKDANKLPCDIISKHINTLSVLYTYSQYTANTKNDDLATRTNFSLRKADNYRQILWCFNNIK